MKSYERVHARAVEVSGLYLRCEAEMIAVLQEVEKERVFVRMGRSSLFDYVVGVLGLGESTAYTLITVARKAREVPALREGLEKGEITLSNAKRVSAVLTFENQKEWLERAGKLTNRQLEREIVKVRPQSATPERASYVSKDRVKLELGLSEAEMLKLRRVQDVLSQKRQKPVSLEETIAALTGEFLGRHDPVEKAKRHVVKQGIKKGGKLVTGTRTPIPAVIRHQVNLRDQGKCTIPGCNQSKFTQTHHIIPVSKGGSNDLSNLTTLCCTHHQREHLPDPLPESPPANSDILGE